MTLEITPDKKPIVELVKAAHEGRLCLPDFQRDFVWSHDGVADLVRSMLRGYYIGSILLLNCDPTDPPFAPAALRGAKPTYTELRPNQLVLDGQQRLTSLIYALTAPDLPLKDSSQRRWFFVDLQKLREDPEDDEIVVNYTKRDLNGLDTPDVQSEQMMMPVTELFSLDKSVQWARQLRKWIQKNRSDDEYDDFEENFESWLTSTITNFSTYNVSVVELPVINESVDDKAIGKVCAIFEKLNSTGIELSVYDLLTAKLYRYVSLHKLWNATCEKYSRIQQWTGGKVDINKCGVLVLRTLALLRGLDPKPSILIKLAPENFEQDWERAVSAIDRALELLYLIGDDGFGVFDHKWLPGTGLVPVLAALRKEIEERQLGEEARRDLRRWYWCNVFLERYSSAVESKSRKDYSEMMAHWLNGQPEPDVFREARNKIGGPGYSVSDSASYASAVYSGIFCLLALRGARDWKQGETIVLQELQDHHIFPQAYLKTAAWNSIDEKQIRNQINSVVNRTLISNATNGAIKDKAPAYYLDQSAIFPSGASLTLLAPHFIDADAYEAMSLATSTSSPDDIATAYKLFTQAREKVIIDEIRERCGVMAFV